MSQQISRSAMVVLYVSDDVQHLDPMRLSRWHLEWMNESIHVLLGTMRPMKVK
jgi:hypothetical protein